MFFSFIVVKTGFVIAYCVKLSSVHLGRIRGIYWNIRSNKEHIVFLLPTDETECIEMTDTQHAAWDDTRQRTAKYDIVLTGDSHWRIRIRMRGRSLGSMRIVARQSKLQAREYGKLRFIEVHDWSTEGFMRENVSFIIACISECTRSTVRTRDYEKAPEHSRAQGLA